MWVIDVIRAGLVEGKLSQQKQVFLVHRTTYRVFGEKQWREVATRLEQWKESLRGVKEVISRERHNRLRLRWNVRCTRLIERPLVWERDDELEETGER